MSILKANLKHLYQRRGLWFVYALVCMISPALLFGIQRNYLVDGAEGQKGLFVALLALSNIAGLFACSMQIDIAIKPFSHCLPGHRRVKRQFLLIVAVVTSFLFSLIYLLYPDIGLTDKMMAVAAAFFAGIISYWIGTLIAFTGNVSASFLGLYPIIGILVSKYDLHIALESAIVAEPNAICIAGIVVSIAAWMMLGSEDWFRRHCGSQWLGLFDAWNWGKVRNSSMKRTDQFKDGILSIAFETACLRTIGNYPRRIKGYLAGTSYATFGGMCRKPSSMAIGLFFILLTVCALGYLKHMGIMVYLVAGMLAVNIRMPVHSTMLIAGGRRERFLSTCFLALTVSVLLSLSASLVALMTHVFDSANIMQPLIVDGEKNHYNSISLAGFFVPFIMVPVGFSLQLIFNRKPIPMMVAWVMFFVFCFITAFIINITNIWWIGAAMVSVALSWIVFLVVLRWVCGTRPLVI